MLGKCSTTETGRRHGRIRMGILRPDTAAPPLRDRPPPPPPQIKTQSLWGPWARARRSRSSWASPVKECATPPFRWGRCERMTRAKSPPVLGAPPGGGGGGPRGGRGDGAVWRAVWCAVWLVKAWNPRPHPKGPPDHQTSPRDKTGELGIKSGEAGGRKGRAGTSAPRGVAAVVEEHGEVSGLGQLELGLEELELRRLVTELQSVGARAGGRAAAAEGTHTRGPVNPRSA